MNENWNNFERMFELRNEIIHNMKDSDLSITPVVSLADNTLNVMDAAAYLGSKSPMDDTVSILKSSKTKREEMQELANRK